MWALNLRLLTSVGALAIAASVAHADTPAINVGTVGTYPPFTANGFNYYQPPGNYTFSWDFTANSPIQVTQLGYYNSALTGLSSDFGFGSHLITLFDVTTDTTLTSATVTAKNPASGVFNYASITPITLNTGDVYQISGTTTYQYYLVGLNKSAAPLAPQINYQFQSNLDIFGTNAPAGTYSDFGPNFEFVSACTENVAGRNIIALKGDSCTAAGTYLPGNSAVTLPVTYNGFGLYANGGTITSSTPVTITTTGEVGSHGAWAAGTGSLIAFGASTTITTGGSNSYGAFATGGGQITASGPLNVNTSGSGAIALYAYGAGSSINAALGTISTTGATALGALADTGGKLTLTGGVFTTSGVDAGAAAVVNGGSLTISGAKLTTTGDGAPGLFINGSGGNVTASNLTISTSGNVWTSGNGSHADGIYNGTFGSFSGGGVMTVTDTTVKTTGYEAPGVSVGVGGTTTFLGGAVATHGQQAQAAEAANGGSLTIGLDAAGYGAGLATSGLGAYVVVASGGGLVSVTGAHIGSTGDGSGGLGINGAGSEIDATNVYIVTIGVYDPVTNLHSYGAANTPYGSFATGGVLKLTNSTINTFGQSTFGVYTGASSTTTITGGTISTFGAGAHALVATGAGADVTVGGATISTYGTGSYGAYVASGASLAINNGVLMQSFVPGGGGLFVTGAGSTATINGAVGISSQSGASALWAGAGGAISIKGTLGLEAVGTAITVNGGASAGSISAPGTLYLKALSASSPAILLSGDNASFSGTGGGVISAAGPVVEFLNGTNQSATFNGYTIVNTSGDLLFADPSSSTINYNNTTVSAGNGNLVNATNASTVTLNANASMLFGAVATDATSTTNVNLSNASALTLTGNSTITNLNLNNSALGFSSPVNGAFKTLTVTNFIGTGGSVVLNAALGGVAGADQIVVNGGRATGTTLLTIIPVGPTTGANVPLIVATNGGSIAPGAFALSSPIVINGYLYTLQDQGGADYLVSNNTQTPSQGSSSLTSLSQSRQTQTITSRILSSILTGATEQINCSSCSSGFASFGSFALGLHGRWTISPTLAILAGGSYDSFSGRGVTVNNSMQFALALRYDAVTLGKYRPFVEAGLTTQPWASVTYSRAYQSALGGGVGTGTALSRSVAAYGRLGYIWRLTRTDEAAVYTDLTRSWDSTSGYTESATPGNPNGATVAPALDTLNVWRTGAQFTHLFGQHIEGNLSGGFAEAFGASYGTSAALGGLGVETGSAARGFHWWELGGRVSYRFSQTVTGDLFVLGALGAQPVGNQVHGGAALRMAF